jgi:hypothetical protein
MNNYTHYTSCCNCQKVVALLEYETVEMWPNGYPRDQFRHSCATEGQGSGTLAPRIIPNGPLDREQALALLPFGELDWPAH